MYMITDAEGTPLPTALAAVDKFYEMNDDLDAVQALNRRTIFEFLRTMPTLTIGEIDTLASISELLADLCVAKRNAKI